MGKGKDKKDKRDKKGKHKRTLAEEADRYALYQKAVQNPAFDVKFFQKAFKSSYGRKARVLREDFCAAAAVCCAWVRGDEARIAYGVDLDPVPLDWGQRHNLAKLEPNQRERVHLVQGDVRTALTPKADIVAAQNFSYMVFKTRDELRRYFRAASGNLANEGVLILDVFGGYEVIEDNREDIVEHRRFDYVWDQVSYDPITHDAVFHIHFRFPDKSHITPAFVYEWRLWTIPEVCEVLVEAGFAKAEVYWEGDDKKSGEGNGRYEAQKHGSSDPAWNVYVVGKK